MNPGDHWQSDDVDAIAYFYVFLVIVHQGEGEGMWSKG